MGNGCTQHGRALGGCGCDPGACADRAAVRLAPVPDGDPGRRPARPAAAVALLVGELVAYATAAALAVILVAHLAGCGASGQHVRDVGVGTGATVAGCVLGATGPCVEPDTFAGAAWTEYGLCLVQESAPCALAAITAGVVSLAGGQMTVACDLDAVAECVIATQCATETQAMTAAHGCWQSVCGQQP